MVFPDVSGSWLGWQDSGSLCSAMRRKKQAVLSHLTFLRYLELQYEVCWFSREKLIRYEQTTKNRRRIEE